MNFIQLTLSQKEAVKIEEHSLDVKDVNQKTSSSNADTSKKEEMLLGQGHVVRIKGNFIGMLNNGVLTCDRKLKGKFRNFDGWGLSRQLIFEMVQTCKERGMIIFNIKDYGKTVYILRVSAMNFLTKGIPYHNPKLDEDQLILPESLWDKEMKTSVKIL